jgi:hypothetical protein
VALPKASEARRGLLATAHARVKELRAQLADDPWLLASVLGLVVLLACVGVFGRDAGLIWDDSLHLEYGNRILSWFQSGFRNRGAMKFMNLYLYGGLFDAPAQWLTQLSPFGPYETRHMLCAMLAVLGVVAAFKTAALLSGPRAGFLAGATLVLTPAWTGHGLFNPKDIPFGTAAAFVALACTHIALTEAPLAWRFALRAGVCVGLALAVRAGGMFLFAFPLLAALGRATLEAWTRHQRGQPMQVPRLVGTIGRRLAAAFTLAWLLMLSAWPWAQLAPLRRPFEAVTRAAHFAWDGDVLFNGHVFVAPQLPRSYLFVWFGITLPELYLVALALSVAALALRWRALSGAHNRARILAITILALFVILPLAGVVIQRPVLYDAQRHFLFLLPPLSVLAGIGLSAFFDSVRRSYIRIAAALLLCSTAALTAADMVSLHPYEYIYFNRLFGGLPAAAGRFETDYWGASYRDGFAWLVQNVSPSKGQTLSVGGCGGDKQIEYYLERWPSAAKHFTFVGNKDDADFLIATTRYNCHRVNGKVLHTLGRQGVPLVYVIQLRSPAREHKRHHKRS